MSQTVFSHLIVVSLLATGFAGAAPSEAPYEPLPPAGAVVPAHVHDKPSGSSAGDSPTPRPSACVTDATAFPYHFHAVYAYPTDVGNRATTMAPKIRAAIEQSNGNLDDNASLSGATATYRMLCEVDLTIKVSTLALSTTSAETTGSSWRNDLGAAGFNAPGAKYVGFLDIESSASVGCSASQSDIDTLTLENPNNFGSTIELERGECGWEDPDGGAFMHETGHSMGNVFNSAKGSDKAGHCLTATADTMCKSSPLGQSCAMPRYDCGQDDYFNPAPAPTNYLADHWNVGSRLNRYVQLGGAGNKAPELRSVSCTPYPATAAQSVSCAFQANDDGWGVAYSVNWGDGSPVQRIPPSGFAIPGIATSASHTWAVGGAYAVTVAAIDTDAPASSTPTSTYCMRITPFTTTAPCAPLALAPAPGNGAVTLTWGSLGHGGSAITSYKVYRGTSNPPTTLINSGGCGNLGAVLTCTDSGRTNGVTYYYAVKATSAAGTSALSNVVGATPVAPTVPISPWVVQTPGDDSVTLTLQPRSNGGSALTGYKVYRALTSGGQGGTPYATIGPVPTWVDTGVTNGQTYYYIVKATNAVGDSLPTLEYASTPVGPPSPPVVVVKPGNARTFVQWQRPVDTGGAPIHQYDVWGGPTSSPASMTFLYRLELATVNWWTETDLANGVPRYYFVRAMNEGGFSADSNVVGATPAVNSYADAPSGLMALAVLGGHINVSWSAPSETGGNTITGYRLYRGPSVDGLLPLATIGVNTSFSDQSVVVGTPYTYAAVAITATGEGQFSSTSNAVPTSATVPDAPGSVIALAGDTQVRISWTPPADGGSPVTWYRLYRGTSPGVLSTWWYVPAGNTSTIDAQRINGVAYYYALRAQNTMGVSVQSAEVAVTPSPNPPTPPLALAAAPVNQQVALQWSAPLYDAGNAVTNYLVYRSTTPGAFDYGTTIWGSQTTSTIDPTAAAGITYYYQVTAVNSVGQSTPGNEVTATITLPALLFVCPATTIVAGTNPNPGCSNMRSSDPAAALLTEDGGATKKKFDQTHYSDGVGPAGSIHTLTIRARAATNPETLNVKVWNGAAYVTQLSILSTDTSFTEKTYTLTTPEWNGGSPRIEFVDAQQTSDGGVSTWEIDYVMVVTS